MKSGTEKVGYNSICIATYNGEFYIEKQIISILNQINDDDEIIIVDDDSSDNTVQILTNLNDHRIKILVNDKNLGVNSSFEKAIQLSTGKYIFLSDQDDIWTENRYNRMIEEIENKGVFCISGNTIAISADDKKLNYSFGQLFSSDENKYKKNILRIFFGHAYYYGCAMVFDNKLKDYILPFPDNLESHDLWIAMVANALKSNGHLEEVVLKRRIHGKNASIVKRNIMLKIKSRFVFLSMFFRIKKRIKRKAYYE